MNLRARMISATLILASAPSAALASDGPRVRYDLAGDTVECRTDPERVGVLGAGCKKPNILSLAIGAWQSPTASTNPYAGSYCDPEHAHLFRMDLELVGVINPPGSATLSSYSPFTFGPSPLYGYIELDIDRDRDTGGELGGPAKTRFLANIGRFGRSPYGSTHSRAAQYGWQLDANFTSEPQFERNGADFVLAFCGCYPTTIETEGGNGNHIFEAGETWIVRGGFFQRAGGFKEICSSTGGAAGLEPGLYVPWVKLRWSHDIQYNRTTVTLVYAIDQFGAGQLVGQPPEIPDTNVSNQTSIVEALKEVIDHVGMASNGSPVWYLCNRWAGHDPTQGPYLDPTHWDVTAMVGTAYTAPVQGAAFVWTDSGFDDTIRDLTGDGTSNASDKQVIQNAIDTLDGSVRDAEGNGRENGSVTLISPGVNFAMADVNNNGKIDAGDIRSFCIADFNHDGTINILDYVAFFDAFTQFDFRADLNINALLDGGDFAEFLNAAASGC